MIKTVSRLQIYMHRVQLSGIRPVPLKMYFFKGCFVIKSIPEGHRQHQATIRNNAVEGCYQECQTWNSSCGRNEPVYSALKVT